MPQNIQLQQIGINGVIIKMRADNIAVGVIRRMLHRGKGVDILSHRKDDNAARMLAGRPPDSRASLHNPVYFAAAFVNSFFLIIVFHKTESGLVCQCPDGSRLKGLSGAEDNLCVFVRLCLIFPRKIQVNIRLLVPLEPQKGLKRNVKAEFLHFSAAHRTVFIRHIAPGHSHLPVFFHVRRIKLHVLVILAQIMRRQRIYLCNPRHRSRKGGSDRTAGPHQIAVLVALPYQLLGDDVHHRIAVADDGVQLPVQALLHDIRKLIPVDLVSPPVTDLPEHFIRVFDHRREFSRPDGADLLNGIADFPGIVDHDLPGGFLPQIIKFLQHFLRCPEEKRRLLIRILKFFSFHDNAAVNLILRIHEMNVTGGHHRFPELLSKLQDFFIKLLQILHGLNGRDFLILQHKCVISQRLNFQIIIEADDSGNFLRRRSP